VCLQCGECCHLGFIKKEFIWLIAQHITPISGQGILGAFLGLSHENQDRWSPYLQVPPLSKKNGAHIQMEWAENLIQKRLNHALQDCQMQHNSVHINERGMWGDQKKKVEWTISVIQGPIWILPHLKIHSNHDVWSKIPCRGIITFPCCCGLRLPTYPHSFCAPLFVLSI